VCDLQRLTSFGVFLCLVTLVVEISMQNVHILSSMYIYSLQCTYARIFTKRYVTRLIAMYEM